MKTVRLLFSDDMVRAIVSGRKTVTRRPVDFRRLPHGVIEERAGFGLWPFWEDEAGDWHPETRQAEPGDLLIGRECWAWSGDKSVPVEDRVRIGEVWFRATFITSHTAIRWRPSIHMPDWAARIRRRVVSVTVERLQDISRADVLAEGCDFSDPREFAHVWDSVYAEKGLGWSVNPWVWRIEFERMKGEMGWQA